MRLTRNRAGRMPRTGTPIALHPPDGSAPCPGPPGADVAENPVRVSDTLTGSAAQAPGRPAAAEALHTVLPPPPAPLTDTARARRPAAQRARPTGRTTPPVSPGGAAPTPGR
ncbi:hypothetical protein SSP531S_10180 [Streptomyces spongiicola]|uniref:Uncharacterized protein n=1 Tax=Streptomyces spongiicola TaxID=1690221 RepID=A0A388SU55_9ACTN|nr:hypothetical protein SSP531S_10180 [Streptomyces spongiicola]